MAQGAIETGISAEGWPYLKVRIGSTPTTIYETFRANTASYNSNSYLPTAIYETFRASPASYNSHAYMPAVDDNSYQRYQIVGDLIFYIENGQLKVNQDILSALLFLANYQNFDKVFGVLRMMIEDRLSHIPEPKLGPDVDKYNDILVAFTWLIYYLCPAVRELFDSSVGYNVIQDISARISPRNSQKAASDFILSIDPEFIIAKSIRDLSKKYLNTSSPRMVNLIKGICRHKILQDTSMYQVMQSGPSDFVPFEDKLICSKDVNCIELNQFKGLVSLAKVFPLNYIYGLYENEIRPRYRSRLTEDSIRFLKLFSLQKAYKFIVTESTYYINDISYQYYAYPADKIPDSLKSKYPNGIILPKKPKNVNELHDRVSIQYKEIHAAIQNRPIPYSEDELQLETHMLGYRIILLKETKTLIQWGAELENCIASYGAKAASKDCILLGLERDGKLEYAIELDRNLNIVQFEGYKRAKNAELEKDLQLFLAKVKLERQFKAVSND